MKTMKTTTTMCALFVFALFVFGGCGGGEFHDTPIPDSGTGGTAGSSGTGGTGGTAGNGGTAGSSGEGGTGGTAGSSGTGGVGGEAGDAGPDATGGTAGDAGSGGAGGSGGNAGSGGDAGPEADATDPCSVPVTAQEVADMLGVDCATYFGASCGTVDVITRSDVVVAVVDQVPPELFQGYAYSATNLPTLPPYSDVPFSHPNLIQIDLAKWLGAIGDAVKFFPDDPALTCWTQEVVDRANDLPTFYLVPSVNTADGNLGAAAGPVTTTRYLLYGTSSSTHLTSLRVVNNLQANFTLSQPTNALEAVVVRCEVPSGGSYTPYSLPLAASGQADFGSLDCYSQTGAPMELQLQMDPASTGVGQQARIGVDPTTLVVRSGVIGDQSNNPLKTVN